LVQYERESFDGVAMNYLLGELRYKEGFAGYYLVCWALKTPLITLLLTLAAVSYFISRRVARRRFVFFFLVPFVVIMIFLSSSSVQSGYRYLLPLLTICFVFIGAAIPALIEQYATFARPVLIGIPLLVAVFSFPNYIA